MKRLIIAIVCLITMVLSANAQYDDMYYSIRNKTPYGNYKSYKISNNICYSVYDNIIYIKTGVETSHTYKNTYIFSEGYAIYNKNTADFIIFLKEIKSLFTRYIKISEDNNVTKFNKMLNLKCPHVMGYKKGEDLSLKRMFENCGYPNLLGGDFSTNFKVDAIGDCKIVCYFKYKINDKIKNISWTIESPEMIDEIIEELYCVNTRIITLKKILKEEKEKRQREYEAELREKKRIENLFN